MNVWQRGYDFGYLQGLKNANIRDSRAIVDVVVKKPSSDVEKLQSSLDTCLQAYENSPENGPILNSLKQSCMNAWWSLHELIGSDSYNYLSSMCNDVDSAIMAYNQAVETNDKRLMNTRKHECKNTWWCLYQSTRLFSV